LSIYTQKQENQFPRFTQLVWASIGVDLRAVVRGAIVADRVNEKSAAGFDSAWM
jgi:hypothetical protein